MSVLFLRHLNLSDFKGINNCCHLRLSFIHLQKEDVLFHRVYRLALVFSTVADSGEIKL